MQADDDEVLRNLVKAGTEAVCIVAKASEMHVTEALRTTRSTRRWRMAAESVAFLRDHDLRVFFDAEHFFDGYRSKPGNSAAGAACRGRRRCGDARALRHERWDPSARGRARSWPRWWVPSTARSVCTSTTTPVARSQTRSPAVRAGATQVQGCVNGYGERAGNADLIGSHP